MNPKYLRRAIGEIGRGAARNDLRLELAVCHGRCFVGAFLALGRPVPIAIPNGRACALVAGVAESLRMPDDWLDASLPAYLVESAAEGRLVQEARDAGLQLSVNESARVLAYKLSVLEVADPRRDSDAADVARLLRGMRAVSAAQIEAIFARYCPDAELGAAARGVLTRALPQGGLRV